MEMDSESEKTPNRGRVVRWAAVVGILAAIAYANSIGNGFAYDDTSIIENNDRIHSLARLPDAVSTPYWPDEMGRDLGLWRPLTMLSYAVEWTLWSGNPHLFHATNVLLHGINSVLVLLLLLELAPLTGAVVGAVIFALHPVHVEAVANVVGRAELLMCLFALLASILYLKLGPARVGAIGGIGACYALSFLSKETGVMLPAVLPIFDLARGSVTRGNVAMYLRRRVPLYGVLGAIAVLILALRHAVLGSIAEALAPLGADVLNTTGRLWTVITIWPHYVRLLFYPADLSADYSPEVIPIAFGPTTAVYVGIACALLAVATQLAWKAGPTGPARATPRCVAAGVLLFCATILPVSNIPFLTGVLLAERTLYLPSIGLSLAIAWFASKVADESPRLGAGALVFFAVLLLGRTVTRNPTWKDTATVMETLIREHPEAGRAQWILGQALFKMGRPQEGMEAYRRAIATLGEHYPLLTDVARDLINQGREDEAEPLLRKAYEQRPEMNLAPHLLTVVLVRQGRYAEAEHAALAALRADSTDAVAAHLLATAYDSLGRVEDAITARRRAIEAGEGTHWQQWYWLAEAQMRVGRMQDARISIDSALVRAATDADRDQVMRLAGKLESNGGR